MFSVGGYISSRVYTSVGGTDKRKTAFLTATALPTCVLFSNLVTCIIDPHPCRLSLVFAMVFLLDLFLITAGSSGAVPFGKGSCPSRICHDTQILLGTFLFVVILWFGISAPLSAVGSYFGSKHGVSSVCVTSLISVT